MSTIENLKTAFAGESQANRKYKAFAKKAEEEGFKQVAKLFRAAAKAETIHALNHLNVLGEVKSTKENLKAAIDGESYENTEMYPKFIKEAEEEGNEQAVLSFKGANTAEEIHKKLYEKALEKLEQGSDLETIDYYVCEVCGYTAEGEAPETCPVCNVSKDKFIKIE